MKRRPWHAPLASLDLPQRWRDARAWWQRLVHGGGEPAGFRAGRHGGPGEPRDYKLFVPAGASGRGRPLLVMLHGCTQDPDDFARGTRMNALAAAEGFLVLYPQQSERFNKHRCWNWFEPRHQRRDRGEPALLAEMTRQVRAEHGVDARRVYVAGLSAGGAMAALLAREYPDLFAAAAVHSGVPCGVAKGVISALHTMKHGPTPLQALLPKPPMPPLLVFHGDGDAVVHPLNGHTLVADALSDRTHAPHVELGHTQGRRFTRSTYRDAQGRVQVEHWEVHGLGHAWSGGDPAGTYADANGPDASRELWRFFMEHSRASIG